MQFCVDCGRIMTKVVGERTFATEETDAEEQPDTQVRQLPPAPYGVSFRCQCGNYTPGTKNDTLMYEEHSESQNQDVKFNTFLENAAHDPAKYVVKVPCEQCGLPFMALARVGSSQTTLYICTCGYRRAVAA